MPSQTQGVPGWTQDLDYPQKFLLRVVAHRGNPNPSFFIASYIKFWNKNLFFFVLIQILQGFKTFCVYLKALLEKLFQTCYFPLKNFWENESFQNTILQLLKSYASLFAKEWFTERVMLNKVCISKTMFENEFQNIIL
jgi:hypothetical protein